MKCEWVDRLAPESIAAAVLKRVLPRTEIADDAVTFDAQEAPGGSSG
jgi:hypothetical protein